MTVILEWNLYIEYLKQWADNHSSPEFAGMSPAGFDEWLDNECANFKDCEALYDC